MCCWFAEALFLCSAANMHVGISTLISFTGRKCMWQIRFQTETYFKCFYLFNWRHFISKDCEFITKSTQAQVQVLCSNCDYIYTQNNHSDALFSPVQSTASSLNHKNNTAHVETACSACWCSCILLSAPHWTEFTQWKVCLQQGNRKSVLQFLLSWFVSGLLREFEKWQNVMTKLTIRRWTEVCTTVPQALFVYNFILK